MAKYCLVNFKAILSSISIPTCTNTVLEGALIEKIGRKTRQFWMHSILYFQAEWTNSQNNQSLKQ
jgi:hypothetical protein